MSAGGDAGCCATGCGLGGWLWGGVCVVLAWIGAGSGVDMEGVVGDWERKG